MSSVTGGQLTFAYNTFLQRNNNLGDIQDPAVARTNLGISTLGTLTFGTGLLPANGTFNFATPATISVNASSTGTAGSIAQYDSSGSLTSSGPVNVGYGSVASSSSLNFYAGTTGALASITRSSGTNGVLTISNLGTGGLVLGATSLTGGFLADSITTSGVSLNLGTGSVSQDTLVNFNCGTSSALGYIQRSKGTNGSLLVTNSGTGGLTLSSGTGVLQMVSSSTASLVSASTFAMTTAGTTMALASGSTGATALTINSTTANGAGAGNSALAVLGGATMDALTVTNLNVSGTLGGTTLAALTTSVTNKLDAVTTTAQTVASAVTFSKPIILSTQPSWCLTLTNYSTTSTVSISPFTPSSPTSVSLRGCSISAGGVVYPATAGRYLITFAGQVQGNGQVQLAYSFIQGITLVTSYTVWNGTTTNMGVSGTYLIDVLYGSTNNWLSCGVLANSGTFTIVSGSFTGYMIG
jgi:hypothetical protein